LVYESFCLGVALVLQIFHNSLKAADAGHNVSFASMAKRCMTYHWLLVYLCQCTNRTCGKQAILLSMCCRVYMQAVE
jgi:hypothetical protein